MIPKIRDVRLRYFFSSYPNFFFKITEKKNPLQFVSPKVQIVSITNDCRNFLLSTDSYKKNDNNFINFLMKLEERVLKNKEILFSKIGKINEVDDYDFRSCICNYKDKLYVSCKIINENINIYDYNKEPIKLEDIEKRSIGKFLLIIDKLVITKNSWFLNLSIAQIKILEYIPPNICVIEDEVKTPPIVNKIIQDKYSKMLSMGIPLDAVKNKCIMDGNDPDMIGKNPKLNKPSFLNSISNKNFQLKKTTIDPKPKNIKQNNGPEITLDDIVSTLAKLRSIK